MAEALSLSSLYILLGVLAGFAVLGAIVWAARRAVGRHGAGSATNEVAGDGDGNRKGLLNKDVVVAPVALGGQAPADSNGDAQLCAICKARLAGAECRRLRPCGHLYHAECIDLWLERKWICPLCRAGVVVSRTETIDAMV